MEMKIKGDKFFVLETVKEKWIYETEDNAIKALRDLVSKTKDLNPENVSILEVNVREKKWEIRPISWSKIAIELMREGR